MWWIIGGFVIGIIMLFNIYTELDGSICNVARVVDQACYTIRDLEVQIDTLRERADNLENTLIVLNEEKAIKDGFQDVSEF